VLLLIDNYDSFTYNLVHFLGDLGAECAVHRNDQITVEAAMALRPDAIVLSPGPCTPNEAGICMDLIKAAAKAQVPLLGVCLGHQAIGQVFGGKVVRAPKPMHGKLSGIQHKGQSVFEDVPSPFEATRYHSLIVDRAGFPAELDVTAETGDIIMACATRACRSTACSSTPRASPRSTATRSSRTSSRSPASTRRSRRRKRRKRDLR